ncbi:MAG: AmmeMemoRadiSam system protein A [Leptospirales bacterium]|nr:AmmeMemoRadiSam system protein A [Leptospirales bacterium]
MIEFDTEQQFSLLSLARKTIADKLNVETSIEPAAFDEKIYMEKCGAFVTLHKKGKLRGCIGYIEGHKPVPDTVKEMAISAAFKDSRFSPLKADEYDLIDLEISILSPIEKVEDVSEIVVGRDGLIITRGYNRGLLLPQVATEQGWDRKTFLEQTCRKAGLPANAWQEPSTVIEKFSAQVFGEKSLPVSE